jgi:hypothetical protein
LDQLLAGYDKYQNGSSDAGTWHLRKLPVKPPVSLGLAWESPEIWGILKELELAAL